MWYILRSQGEGNFSLINLLTSHSSFLEKQQQQQLFYFSQATFRGNSEAPPELSKSGTKLRRHTHTHTHTPVDLNA